MFYREKEIIDAKDIEKIVGIEIHNPEYRKFLNNSIHAKIVILLSKHFCGRLLNKLYKNADFENMYVDNNDSIFSRDIDNSAKRIKDDRSNNVSPFFNIEYIQFTEFVPKDFSIFFVKRFDDFKSKYISSYEKKDLDAELKAEYNILNGFTINSNTELGLLYSFCTVRMEEITPSFDMVCFRFYYNEETIIKLSNFLVDNTPDYERFFNLDRVKYRYSWAIEKGYISGINCKRYIVDAISEELKYRILNCLNKYDLLPMNDSISSRASFYTETNIDGNDNKEFWQSIKVFTSTCNESIKHNACVIDWGNNFVCISNSSIDESGEDFYGLYALDDFNQYTAIENVMTTCKAKLSFLKMGFQNAHGKSIKFWLDLKKYYNNNLLYINRLLDEYHMDYQPKWKYRSEIGELFSNNVNENINTEIYSLHHEMETIIKVIDSRINDENNVASYSLQNKTYIIAIVAAIISLVGVVVAIITYIA